MYEAATPYISKEHREFLKKVKRKNVLIRVTQFALLILFFATWEIVAMYKICLLYTSDAADE